MSPREFIEDTLSHCLKGEGVSIQQEFITSEFYKLTRKKPATRTKAVDDAIPGANDLVWRSAHANRNEERKRKEICEAMGGWLLTLAPWNWFASVTFNRLVSAKRITGSIVMWIGCRKHLACPYERFAQTNTAPVEVGCTFTLSWAVSVSALHPILAH
jgi:hypothetical protein